MTYFGALLVSGCAKMVRYLILVSGILLPNIFLP